MKKGLLSILASALLVVGCQNYDDQFTLLENQITALTQTVDGLSQVQSTLASLSGTVNSLSSTVTGLGDAIDTAVAEGLADIQEDITAIEAAVENVASSDAVSDLADAVASSQEDLDELLANSSVFTGDVTINSVATLDAFHAMGSSLAIVNGHVTFDVKKDMDITKVQTVADKMLTIVKDLKYEAEANTIAEVHFNNLSGVQSLTVNQAGGIVFPELVTATIVVLNDAFENKITNVSFPKLESVTSIETGSDSDSVIFTSATNMDFGALKRYPNSTLALETDEAATLNIASLDDVNSDGTQKDLTLSVKGPKSFTSTLINDGTSMTVEDVETVSISDFRGNIIVKGGVETLTIVNGVQVSFSEADALSTVTIGMILDNEPNLSTTATAALPYDGTGDLSFSSMGDLTSVTITGETGAISFSGNANLESISVNAKADDLTIDNNDDLTSVTVTGSSFADVSVTGNADLESLTLDHTTILTKSLKAAPTAVTATISHNPKLASLTFGADKVKTLTVTNNLKLETIDFTGLATIGGTADTATVLIKNNKLAATEYRDLYDATKNGTGEATDTGKYTTTSGMNTLKKYLDAAVAAPTTDGVIIYFDIVENSVDVNSAGTETSSIPGTNGVAQTADYADVDSDFAVVNTKAATYTDIDTVKQTTTMVIDLKRNSLLADPAVTSSEGVNITFAGVTLSVVGNDTIDTVAELVAELDGNTAFGSEGTVTADRSVYNKSYYKITFTDNGSNASIATSGNLYYHWSDDASGTVYLGATNFGAGGVSMALALAASINSLDDDYTAEAHTISGTIIVYATVSGTANNNLGPGAKARKTLTVNATTVTTTLTLTTDNLADTVSASNKAALASNTVLSIAKTDVTGIRVTVTNNNTGVNHHTATKMGVKGAALHTATATLLTGNSGNMTTPTIDTSDGILTTDKSNGYAAYLATFAQVQAPALSAAAAITDRTSWLDD